MGASGAPFVVEKRNRRMRGINDRSSACDRIGGDLVVVVSKLHLDPPTVIGEIYRLLDHFKARITQTLALQRQL